MNERNKEVRAAGGNEQGRPGQQQPRQDQPGQPDKKQGGYNPGQQGGSEENPSKRQGM